jgi:Na+-transporting NADH:ubiquinone oxidoreductase subunit C
MQRSAAYVLGFAAVICVICAVFVSSAAVSLKDLQDFNANAFRQENVLAAAGMLDPNETIDTAELQRRFESIQSVAINTSTGAPAPEVDVETFDLMKATSDPATSRRAPQNRGGVQRLPENTVVYEVRDDAGALEMVILPIWGKGLWSTLYGFLALDADLTTIRGITFYEHKETPGLGGEVDNPRWKALWQGRKAYDDSGDVAIEVIKGQAGPPAEDPYEVDGLTGATITSRGVSNFVQFWLSEDGYGPYLDRLRGEI